MTRNKKEPSAAAAFGGGGGGGRSMLGWMAKTSSSFSSSSSSTSSSSSSSSNSALLLSSSASHSSESSSSSESLVPETNPDADTSAASVSGVRHAAVFDSIQALYPAAQLAARNAASRKDGYWPYVRAGDDPPVQLTYGEFDFYFFASLLDTVAVKYLGNESDRSNSDSYYGDKVFCDIGSGTGRLVLAAAALHPRMKLCRGIELLPTIHDAAVENLEKCLISDGDGGGHPSYDLAAAAEAAAETEDRKDNDENNFSSSSSSSSLPLAPVRFTCGSFDDPYTYFGDADVVFCFSSCLTERLLQQLAVAVGRQCRAGTVVITTEYALPAAGDVPAVAGDEGRLPAGHYKLKLAETVEGWCWLTGGSSTAYVHVLEESAAPAGTTAGGPLERPVPTAEEQAAAVVAAMESGTLTDTDKFLTAVSNNIAFYNLPDQFRPDSNSRRGPREPREQ